MRTKVNMKTEDGATVEFEIETVKGQNYKYKLFSYNSELCHLLNLKLHQYPKTDFVAENSEGIFKIREHDYKPLVPILKQFS